MAAKPHLFEVDLHWIAESRGTLHSKETTGVLHVEAPPAFGGKGKPWTPEHFFLGAISSCFMTTFLFFAKKFELPIVSLSCPAIGKVELVEGRLKFVNIDLYPEIKIADEILRDKAKLALEKTHKHCLISNSVNADIFYHSRIVDGISVAQDATLA
jgi:organic hydroperoxide reductase OsmC/OhrA